MTDYDNKYSHTLCIFARQPDMLDLKIDSQGQTILSAPLSHWVITANDQHGLEQFDLANSNAVQCPYVGFRAFTERDSLRFFGQVQLIQQLRKQFQQLHTPNLTDRQSPAIRFLPLIGPSGSGKSSIIRAGLIPELVRQPIEQLRYARILIMQPGCQPIATLKHLLNQATTPRPSRPINITQADDLRQYLPKLLDAYTQHVILYVDQWEQLYHPQQDPVSRKLFIDNLLQAAAAANSHFSVMATIDSGVFSALQGHPLLYQTCAQQAVLMTALSTQELRQAITAPVQNTEYQWENVMVTHFINEYKNRLCALTELQFTLSQLWQRRHRNPNQAMDDLTLTHIGGSKIIIERTLQQQYDQLPPEEQTRFWRIINKLVQLNDLGHPTYPVVRLSQLSNGTDRQVDIFLLLQRLYRADWQLIRLVSEQPELTVQMSRGILFENWSLLRRWQRQQQQCLLLHQLVAHDAQQWERSQHAPGYLWTTERLRLLNEFPKSCRQQISALQDEFLETAQIRQQRFNKMRHFLWVGMGLFIFGLSNQIYHLTLKIETLHIARSELNHYADTLKQDRDFAFERAFQAQLSAQTLREELQKARLDIQHTWQAQQEAQRTLDDLLESRLNQRNPSPKVLARQCELYCTPENLAPINSKNNHNKKKTGG
jgi:energy-coupling factor transporter ATP-binding protein EcfA2